MVETADEVWQLIGELAIAQKETKQLIREVARENRERGQQVDERIVQANQQLNEQINRVDQQIGQVNKRISDLGGAWVQFVEDLVAPACERIFLDRGIPVERVSQRVRQRRNGETMEIDVKLGKGHRSNL